MEANTDLKVPTKFKTVYPPNWEQRKKMSNKEKTKYFNNWASKL